MNNFLKITIFCLALIGAYTLFSVKFVPDITPEAPPKDEAKDFGRMSVEEIVSFGGELYNGRGLCTVCHGGAGARAPLLDNAAGAAEERIKDKNYKGAAKNSGEYLYESLVRPSAYVVPGYGAAGSGGAVSPMPDVTGPEVGLTAEEVLAVIAYLQARAGVPVSVKMPSDKTP